MLKVFVNEGDKFCRLTVLKEEVPIKQKNGRIKRMLKCQCDCGKVIVVPFHKVVSGKLKSCGCLVGDLGSERRKKYNTYETDGNVTKIYDAKGNYTLIDTEDLEKVKPYYFSKMTKGYFATSPCLRNVEGMLYLHRFIVDCPKGLQVDHINHDKSDNRKANLRICTNQQNMMNKKAKGYYFRKDTHKWQAELWYKKKKINLGCYATEEEAKQARKAGELKYFGEFVYQELQ